VASPTYYYFLEAQQHILMGLQIANTIFYEEYKFKYRILEEINC
jgi:hypothetical protein